MKSDINVYKNFSYPYYTFLYPYSYVPPSSKSTAVAAAEAKQIDRNIKCCYKDKIEYQSILKVERNNSQQISHSTNRLLDN